MTDVQAAPLGAGTATEREIAQQPAVWRQTGELVAERRGEIDAFLAPLLDTAALRIVLTGAGTSAFVGEVLAPALTRGLGRRVDAVATTDIVADPYGRFAEDVPTLLVSFARSGNSPESRAATAIADQVLSDVHHLVVTCDPAGRLAEAHVADPRSLVLLTPAAANDAGFAMTSSFTSMLLTALLALTGEAPATVEALALAAEAVLADRERIDAVVRQRPGRVIYLGSGPLSGLAREAALKLLELTAGGVDTYFDSALGFRHGPKSVIDERSLVVVFTSADRTTSRYDDDIARELRAGDGTVVAVRAVGTPAVGDWVLDGLAGVSDAFLALPYAVVAQLVALHASVRGGVPTDNPFPGGAVNRVVRGVTIHPLAED